jgi:D-amino peptidase
MRVLISADMEGASGVTWPGDVEPGTEQWQRFRRMLTSDVNAAIAGLRAGGASDVLVNEAHDTMRNILVEDLDTMARMLTGRHKRLGMMEGIDRDVDAVAFVGYHAAAGRNGVLAHTYMGNSLTGFWIDGELASEGLLNALVAAEYGVPVILVTGDDQTCADAKTYAPAARVVAVKECISRYAAICSPPAVTAAWIMEAATEAMQLAGRRPEQPIREHRFEIEFDASHLALATSNIPTVEEMAECRVAFSAPSMRDGMRCFRAVAAVAAAAREEIFG